jgi:plastocyanin domain-containing protein
MNKQAADITSFTAEKKTPLDYFLLVGGWFVSCVSLIIIGLIAYWAIKIPEKNVNSLQ